MRILVTGAGGFVGAAVGKLLAEKKFDVLLQARKPLEQTVENVSACQYVFADLTDPFQVAALPDFDALIHCAALMQGRWEELWRNNVLATQILLSKSQQCKAQHVVLMSTGGVYGYSNGMPATEVSPIHPVGWYGHSKLLAENLVQAFSAMNNMRHTIFRLYFPYGLGQTRGLLVFLLNALNQNGNVSLNAGGQPNMSFCNVDDVARAVLTTISRDKCQGIYNVCSSERYSFKELLRLFEDSDRRFHNVVQTNQQVGDLIASNFKLINDFGWTPQTDLISFINSIKEN